MPAIQATRSQLVAFFVLSTLGQILLLAFLVTALLVKTTKRRDGTVLNLCAAMALWALGANLLLYAGHFPAVLVYMGISMSAASVFALVLHLWFSVHAPSVDTPSKWRSILLVGLPYCVGGVMGVSSLVCGLQARDTVILARDSIYCTVGSPVGKISSGLCGLFILGAVVLEAHLGLVVFRRSRARRMAELPRYFTLQLALYTLYAVLTIVVALLLLFANSVLPFIFMSTLPLVVFLLFGTGPDILRVWCCFGPHDRGKGLDSAGESTELSDFSRKERGATLLTSPYSIMTTTAWDTSRA